MYELQDTREHLDSLIKEMHECGRIDFEEYAIDVAHIYAHLNRAWNSRAFKGEMTEAQWEAFREFPVDLEPLA